MPLENVTLEYKDPIKLEGASQDFTTSKAQRTQASGQPGHYSQAQRIQQSTTVALLPCTILTWDNRNPQAKEGTPSQPWKYYVHSFDPSILPIEIMHRREAMERYSVK
ncbi:hypothetical protein F5J12DRAFT_784515 [Pisolithus orientalis]|uniref:uncharacterized protein n=1 Tax=Pisolithus orientalis TaxID=936130 RepID=UPI002224249F|nr:uncharacterized protein F5J12DRAFT_784515 [Pisolithus orientalis]KAI6000212.1 hypothetical protein F5J12DRAFT_784515 [Pisolithus orientalis]